MLASLTHRLVASGMVTLPERTTRMFRSFTVTDTYTDARGDFGIECLWGTDEAPVAVLRVTAPHQMAYTWCKVGMQRRCRACVGI